MPRLLLAILALALVTIHFSCDKDSGSNSRESMFLGTWVKGTNHGDTLVFYRAGGKNMMRSNQSFNPSMQAPWVQEYRYMNGKLQLKFADQFSELDTFTWLEEGKEFRIQGFQVYMFMSSTLTFYDFRKVE